MRINIIDLWNDFKQVFSPEEVNKDDPKKITDEKVKEASEIFRSKKSPQIDNLFALTQESEPEWYHD